MRYYQLQDGQHQRLAVQTADGICDLTAVKTGLNTFRDLCKAASVTEQSIDEVTTRLIDEEHTLSPERFEAERIDPVTADEIWAAGVTYRISEEAREEESDMPEIYLNVYDAPRPEIFFKATPSRTVGPDEPVGIRGDSSWNVPEPELGIVLYEGEPVGYTIGNDMSSRSIEGKNPLYLPQAKTYDRSCAIGPGVTTDIEDPHDLALSMVIYRDGECLYEEATNTGEMIRKCDELVSYFTAHNAVPELSVLLTGTSLVPEDITLHHGDRIEIDIEDIGTLSNRVITV